MKLRKWLYEIFNPEGDPYREAAKWSDEEVNPFVKQLSQTIGWTADLAAHFDGTAAAYASVFRQTNPLIDGKPLYNFNAGYPEWSIDPSEDIYKVLLADAMQRRPFRFDNALPDLASLGRILIFETGISTYDGSPVVESHGFVDTGDVPPIDTWFFLKNNYRQSAYHICAQALFCWIPKQFEAIMQQTIAVEIFDSYRWLDENNYLLYERINTQLQVGLSEKI